MTEQADVITGKTADEAQDRARKAQKKQEALIAEQRKKEEARRAESESDIARRKALASKSGRSLLIKTSERGVQKMGGV
jgi:hypothetical protein